MRTVIDRELLESELPRHIDQVVDIAPIAGVDSDWLLLGDDGGITRWSTRTGSAERLATTAAAAEPCGDPWAGHELRRHLHVSRYGTYAAVVNDYGRYGEVIDLQTGRATFRLDNGGDCHETVPFSFTFAEHRGRTVVIHRTAWNRLDVSTADTGAILTVRPTPQQHTKRYLDYFHGALHLSPSGARVLDDGWVWHPIGVLTVWRIDDWLTRNVWESEDGWSRLDVCGRTRFWDQPVTWLDESRVAVYGIGDDADAIRPGVRIFNVTRDSAVELLQFEGPAGALFSDGDVLYSASAPSLRIWDPALGELLGVVPGFVPTRYHPGTRELVAISGRTMLRWRGI